MGRRLQSRQTKIEEEEVADRIGGRRLFKSGAIPRSDIAVVNSQYPIFPLDDPVRSDEKIPVPTQQGDVANEDWHVEHKRTRAKSMRVQEAWLAKVRDGARVAGKDAAVILSFESEQDWVMIPMKTWMRLCREADEE
jgi:hypothetical protein